MYIIGQVVSLLNPLKSDKAKLIKPKYDPVSGQFLGLSESLGYLTVRGDEQEHFFDYEFNKENNKILYSTHKMKIPDSFSTTISTGIEFGTRLEHFLKLIFVMFSFFTIEN